MPKKEELRVGISKEVVTNYYTGEKWYLVSINGSETYINESEYNERQTKGKRLKSKLT